MTDDVSLDELADAVERIDANQDGLVARLERSDAVRDAATADD